jgi:NRPS condensation-like uncharacterized protein
MKYMISKERTHLFSPAANVSVKIDIEARIDIDTMKMAIDKAVRNNEILNCRIELDEDGEAFYVNMPDPVYSVTVSEQEWTDIVSEQEKIRFMIEKGELIRFFLIPLSDLMRVVIINHHLGGDGVSISYLVRDIMTALSGGELHFKPIRLFSMDEVPKTGSLPLGIRFMLGLNNGNWRKTGKIFNIDDFSGMFKKYWQTHNTVIYRYSFPGTNYEALINEVHAHAVSMNSAITTAFIRASGERTSVGHAVNIRESGYEGMGNFATGISTKYQYDESKDFWHNARQVQNLIYSKLNDDKAKYFLLLFMGSIEPTLIDATMFSAFDGYDNKIAKSFQRMFGYDNNPRGISITNLTRLPISHAYGKYTLSDFSFVAPLVANAKRMISIATLNGKMVLTLHIEDDCDTEANVQFFEKAMSYLHF